jgi:hypothetical protein
MSYYLFLLKGKAAVLSVPGSASSDEWGALKVEFAKACGSRCLSCDSHHVGVFHLYPDQHRDGVFWDEQLAGPGGIGVIAFEFPDTTPGSGQKVLAHLRNTRDVVRARVVDIKQWLPLDTLPCYQMSPRDVPTSLKQS